MGDARRAEIGQRILDLLAGLPHDLALDVQTDVLATSIGGVTYLAGGTPEDALHQIGIVKDNAFQHVLHNWGRIQTMGWV